MLWPRSSSSIFSFTGFGTPQTAKRTDSASRNAALWSRGTPSPNYHGRLSRTPNSSRLQLVTLSLSTVGVCSQLHKNPSPFLKCILLTCLKFENLRRICPQNSLHLRPFLRSKLGSSNRLPQPFSVVLPRFLYRHDHPPCHPRHSEVQSQVRSLMGRV